MRYAFEYGEAITNAYSSASWSIATISDQSWEGRPEIDPVYGNDALHKPATRGAQVYAVEGALISKAAITEKYATMFGDGIGELEGEYRIRLDDTVDPIQHAPRRVPVALRDRLKRLWTTWFDTTSLRLSKNLPSGSARWS